MPSCYRTASRRRALHAAADRLTTLSEGQEDFVVPRRNLQINTALVIDRQRRLHVQLAERNPALLITNNHIRVAGADGTVVRTRCSPRWPGQRRSSAEAWHSWTALTESLPTVECRHCHRPARHRLHQLLLVLGACCVPEREPEPACDSSARRPSTPAAPLWMPTMLP